MSTRSISLTESTARGKRFGSRGSSSSAAGFTVSRFVRVAQASSMRTAVSMWACVVFASGAPVACMRCASQC